MNKLLKAALEYADNGLYVFPCRKDKSPYTNNGVLDATTDPTIIKKWWKKHPKANIGMACGQSGLVMLDFDPGSDEKETYKALGNPPKTHMRVSTPRGGAHHGYETGEGELVANSASKISENVDVRGHNGYTLLPPSRTEDGPYKWIEQGEPQHRTKEMLRVMNSAKARSDDADTWLIEHDLEENIELAIDWLENKARIAVEGEGGDAIAYATGAMMKSYGLSSETAVDLMWNHWNGRCDPPWDEDEFDHFVDKVDNGYEYNTSQPGNMTPAYKKAKRQEVKEMFEPVIKVEDTKDGKAVTYTDGHRFRVANRWAMKQIRKPQWIIEDLIQEETHTLMFGAPGTFKSFLGIHIAASIAQGFSFHDDQLFGDVQVQGPVLYLAGEGRGGINARLEVWEKVYNAGKALENFLLGDPVPSVAQTDEEFDRIIDTILSIPGIHEIQLLVFDTLSRAMQGVDENAQQWASKYINMIDVLIYELSCASLSLGHTPKNDPESYRGSAAFHGGVDTMINVFRPSADYNIQLTMQKQKDAPEWDRPKFAIFEEHELSGGGTSLVVRAAKEEPEDKNAGRKNTSEKKVMENGMIRDAIIKTLRDHPGREFTTSGLSTVVAQLTGFGVDNLRRKRIKDMETEGELVQHYDAVKTRWIWSK